MISSITDIYGSGRSLFRAWALLCLISGLIVCRPASAATYRFAVIGDYGSGDVNEANVATLVRSWNPSFIITLGDNNYSSGSASTIDRNIGQFYHGFIYPYTGAYGAGATENRFFPTLGNHDWNTTTGFQAYLNYFALPNNERYYDFVRGPIQFIALNSDTHEVDGSSSTSIQAQWSRNVMQSSGSTWKLVYFHHAPYVTGGDSNWMKWPFRTWGATAVLAGHVHIYERLFVDNTTYFVNGLGGDDIGSLGSTEKGSVVRYNGNYGAQLVTVTNDTLTFEFYNVNGSLIDRYVIRGPAPRTPTALSAEAVSSEAVSLSWSDASDNEDGFRIERSANGSAFEEVAVTGADAVSYSDTGLSPSTIYAYRVRAYNGTGTSSFSSAATTTTLPSAPDAPSGLAATVTGPNEIDLTWTDNTSDETGFQVERSQDGTTFAPVGTSGPNVTTYVDSGLSPETPYTYRVQANRPGGATAYSNIVTATTLPEPPVAPQSLSVSSVQSTQVSLSWVDASDNEEGFTVERSPDGVAYSPVGSTGAGVAAFTDTGLTPVTSYTYRVRAYNAGGSSAPSNEEVATTSPLPTGPNAPSNLIVTVGPYDWYKLTLNWADNSLDETGFKIERSSDGITFAQITTVGANTTSYVNSSLTALTTYYYRVRAYNGNGNSAYSNIASQTTKPQRPAAPTGLTATAVSSSQINLAWTDASSNEDGFKVYRSLNGTSFTQIAVVGPNVASYASTGLTAATKYYYKVSAYNDGGWQDSNIASATTPGS